jgi:hypothetical protein
VKESETMLRVKLFGICLPVVLLLLAATAAQASYMDAVLANSPIGYWRMGGTGLTTAYDSSGHAYNGTAAAGVALGAVSPGALPNDVSKAATFDGSNTGYVDTNYSSPFDFGINDAFTLEGWIKTTGTGPTGDNLQAILGKYQIGPGAAQQHGYYVGAVNVGNYAAPDWRVTTQFESCVADTSLDGTMYKYAASACSVADGNWHYVAMTHASGASTDSLSLYLDGSLITSTNSYTDGATKLQGIQGTGNLAIGVRRLDGLKPVMGSLDEVAVYGSALSASDIAAHWGARNDIGLTPDPSPEPGTLVLLTTGLIGLLAYAWRRRR